MCTVHMPVFKLLWEGEKGGGNFEPVHPTAATHSEVPLLSGVDLG